MTISFIKTYSVPVYRKIADGDLVSSKSPSLSHLYLDKTAADQVVVTPIVQNNLIPVIYNINRSGKKTTITTNTLNILVSNVCTLKGVYLYHKIELPEDYSKSGIYKYIEEIVGTDNIHTVGDFIYFNNYISKFVEYEEDTFLVLPTILLGNSSQNINGIKRERLKTKIKITFNSPDFFQIKLNCTSIVEPIVHNKNWIEIPECVIIQDNIPVHVYNHTYKEVTKREIQNESTENFNNLKDPVRLDNTEIISETFEGYRKLITYNSYRSNLLLNISLNTELYFYLQNPVVSSNTVCPFIYSPTILSDVNLIPIFTITFKYQADQTYIRINPYSTRIVYSTRPEEVIYYFDREVAEDKYVRPQDITLGKNLLKINPQDLATKRSVYVVETREDGTGSSIIQQNILIDNWIGIPTESIRGVGGYEGIFSLPENSYCAARLEDFVENYTSILENIAVNTFPENPIRAYTTYSTTSLLEDLTNNMFTENNNIITMENNIGILIE